MAVYFPFFQGNVQNGAGFFEVFTYYMDFIFFVPIRTAGSGIPTAIQPTGAISTACAG